MYVKIDEELEPLEIQPFEKNLDLFKISFEEQKDYRNEFEKTVISHGQLTDNCVFHRNYLQYLELCWKYHRDAILDPEVFWHMVLCEIAIEIKNNPAHYRDALTSSENKVEVVVVSKNPKIIPLDQIVQQLHGLVPNGNAEAFIKIFSTMDKSGSRAETAMMAAFADLASQYYNYSMLMCGIPGVALNGTKEDWQSIEDGIYKIMEILPSKVLKKYLSTVAELAKSINSCIGDKISAIALFKDMFALEKCGSGHQTEVVGWIDKMFIKRPRPAYLCNFSSHVSVVKYKNLDTGENFELCSGLFASVEIGNTLAPMFDTIARQIKEV